jgi:archaellum component FlaC
LAIDNIVMLATVLGAITAIILFAGKLIKFIKKVIHFLDDFLGEEERPGQEARPGLSERLTKMEDCMGTVKEQMDSIKEDVESIKVEMHPNSGTTIRDSLNRIETKVQVLDQKLIEHVNMSR